MALTPLLPIKTSLAVAAEEAMANVRRSMERGFPRLHHLPEFAKSKGSLPIALAAGGPSIKESVRELSNWRYPIIAVGSAHDWLMGEGIVPRYALVCDADAGIMASYLKHPSPLTTYLVATQCHESVFKALEGMPISLWHCISAEKDAFLDEVEPGWQGVGGGCTAGLRALSVAIVLGYRNIHFFGYDSCLGADDAHHAYGLQDRANEAEGLGLEQVYNLAFGQHGPESKTYRCLPYHMAQAQNFEEFLRTYHMHFRATFHGEGLLRDVYENIMSQIAENEAIAA